MTLSAPLRLDEVLKWSLILILGACAAIYLPVWLSSVRELGFRIPEEDLSADYILGLSYGLCLFPIIVTLPASRRERTVLLLSWLLRVGIVCGPMLFYEHHYGLDEFSYYERAKWGQLPSLGLRNGTNTMQRVTTLIYQLGPHSFRAVEISFALIGFLAVYIFYRAAVLFMGRGSSALLLILELTPSILFWSSIIGKDPLMLFGVALFSYGTVGLCVRRQSRYIFVTAIGLIVIAAVRLWMVPIVGSGLVMAGMNLRRHLIAKVLLGTLSLALMILSSRAALNAFDVSSQQQLLGTLEKNQHNFEGGGSRGGFNIHLRGWADAVAFAPLGAFNALFRPLPGEVMNVFGVLAGVEDLGFLVLFIRALVRLRRRDLASPVLRGATNLLLMWCFFYGFISSGNMGTAVRYRLQILPILLMVLLYFGNKGKESELAIRRNTSRMKPEFSYT